MFAGIDSHKGHVGGGAGDQVGPPVARAESRTPAPGSSGSGSWWPSIRWCGSGSKARAITAGGTPPISRWTGTSPMSGCSRCRP